MEEFEIYKTLQNLLISMNENVGIHHVLNYIIKKKLLKDECYISSTLKILASYAYSYPKQMNIISYLLKKIPKINFNLYMIDIDYTDVFTDDEVIYRIKILYYLLLNSNHMTESEYEDIYKYYNNTNYYYGFSIGFGSAFDPSKNCCSLYNAIYNDDIDLLQNYIEQENFNIEETIIFPIFELYKYFESPILLEYSAFYGSIRCFKYLLLKSEKVDYGRLLEYAIAGGNFDIIHITENMSHDINITNNVKLLHLSISFMQNDLIQYIVDTYDVKIDGECYNQCINSFNYTAMIMLNDIYDSVSINDFGINGFTPLAHAEYQNRFEFFVYLLSIDEVDYTIKCFDNKSIFFFAVAYDFPQYIDYIIKNKLYAPSDHYLFSIYQPWKVLMHYKEIEEQQKPKEIPIEYHETVDEDFEKDYMIRKRFYEAKFKKMKGKKHYSLKTNERMEVYNYSINKRKKKNFKNNKRHQNYYSIRTAIKEQNQ